MNRSYFFFRPLRQRRTVWGRSWSSSGPLAPTSSLPVEKLRNLKSKRPLMRWEINAVICFWKDKNIFFDMWSCMLNHSHNPFMFLSFSKMNAAWEGLNRTWRERMERLEEAMTASVQYQDALQVCSKTLSIQWNIETNCMFLSYFFSNAIKTFFIYFTW